MSSVKINVTVFEKKRGGGVTGALVFHKHSLFSLCQDKPSAGKNLRGQNVLTETPYMQFLLDCSTSFLKTLWEKGKLLVTSNFTFSHSVFYPFGELSVIFIQFEIVVCKLFQFGIVLNLSFGRGLTGAVHCKKGLRCIFEKVSTHKQHSAQADMGPNTFSLFCKISTSSKDYFCGICRRQCHYEFNTVIRKSCIVFCVKPKGVHPIKLSVSVTNKCFDRKQKKINNGV